MPYISKVDRIPYIPFIEKTVANICAEQEPIRRAEYYGHFLEQMRIAFQGDLVFGDPAYDPTFNAEFSELGKRDQLASLANKVVSLIMRDTDLLKQAGDLNYVMSSVLWGILGDSLHAQPAKYGFRAFVKGILWKIYHRIYGDTRRNTMLQGVITDVIDEMYRRKTTPYEDAKILENGDIWPLREVGWVERCPLFRMDEQEEEQGFLNQ